MLQRVKEIANDSEEERRELVMGSNQGHTRARQVLNHRATSPALGGAEGAPPEMLLVMQTNDQALQNRSQSPVEGGPGRGAAGQEDWK